MSVDSKGRRIYIEDTLEDGETIAFLVGIADGEVNGSGFDFTQNKLC